MNNHVNLLRELMYKIGYHEIRKMHKVNDIAISQRDAMFLRGIANINKGEPIKMSTISDRFDISRPAVTQIIKKFEKKGFVERIILEDDLRSVYVKIKFDIVNPLIKKLDQSMNDELVHLVDSLGENDTKELIRLLIKLADIDERSLYDKSI